MQTGKKAYHVFKRDKGFTLIEVLVALVIFAVGILAVAKMQMANTKNNTTGNVTTLATMLARTQLETLKSDDIASAADLTLGDHADPNNPIDQNGNAGGIFTRTWRVTNPLGGGTSRQVDVTVSWNQLGQTRQVVLTTITRGNGI